MNSEMKPDEKELRKLLDKLENKALRSPNISEYIATMFIKDEIVTFYKNQLNDAVTNVSNAHIKHEQATSGEFETVYQLVGHLAIKNNPLTETQLELVKDFINEFNEGKTNA